MSFSFTCNNCIGEFKYNELLILSWNIGNNDDLFNLYDFELFITRLKNDFDCGFYKNNKTIFKYINKNLIIYPSETSISIQINETNRQDLLTILQKIYDWNQSILISNTLLEHNL
jgi:hypothetical protein